MTTFTTIIFTISLLTHQGAGDKIIFSIGHWGSCHEIMMVVAEAVKPFGDVYYDHNDCDDEDFVKMFQEE